MKRWLILLALLLLLTGCEGEPTEPTTETQLPLIYDSLMEWELPGEGMTLVGAMGDGLLLHDGSQLTLLSADGREVLAAAVLENLANAENGDIQIGRKGVTFYDRQNQRVCFLDEELEKTRYLELQAPVQGRILLTWEWEKLYYCTAEGVHSIDLLTGMSRTIAYRQEDWLGVSGMFMGDMISCSVREKDGTASTLIISTETGVTVFETGKVSQLSSLADLYFCKMTGNGVEEWVFGWGGDQPRNFWASDDTKILPMLGNDMIVTAEESLFRCYDLNTGCCVAQLEFDGAADAQKLVYLNDAVFFTDGAKLYRWDLALTQVEDDTSYTSFRYTLDDPDEEGLQEQQMSAMMMEKLYGVDILMWNEVTEAAPRGYEFAVEYIPEEYDPAMDALRDALDTFGRNFLKTVGKWKDEGELNIVLVRQIRLGDQVLPGLQYVLDDQVYIALTLSEDLEENFYHLMGHAVDTVVLRESLAFDDWEWLNPDGFVYMEDRDAEADHDYSQYLDQDERWFIDENSMRFQVEDRATILAYAIGPENEAYFSGEAMQAKLQMVCRGIREAFGLTGESYIWEQYLKEEIK